MKMIRVDCGQNSIEVPVIDIVGKKPGKTLLVTGGMDGDEYASIEACYRFIDRVSPSDIFGRLIVIPVVNFPGFWAETSVNPIDQKFLKFAGIGKARGSPTQRLVHWLVDTYAKHADLWLDLHGGSRTETIATYLWGWETKVGKIDTFVKKFIVDYTTHFGIFEHQMIPVGKAAALARMGCGYIQGEAGGSGARQEADIRQHESWITSVLRELGMIKPHHLIPRQSSSKSSSTIYSKFEYLRCRKPGLWYPTDTTIRVVKKGEPLGAVRSLSGKKTETLRATHAGQLLWIKEGLRTLPTDDLAAIAHTPYAKT